MSFTDFITRTPKEVYFLIFGVIVITAILESLKRYLRNLKKQRNKSKKQKEKTYEKKIKKLDKVYGTYCITKIDKMNGQEFEIFVERLFKVLEKDKIIKTEFTPPTGDQGCDLIIYYHDGARLGIQCKRYAGKVDNKAVQNIVTAKAIYGLTMVMVFTNNYYTAGAEEAARLNRVELVNRDKLIKMIGNYNELLRKLHNK